MASCRNEIKVLDVRWRYDLVEGGQLAQEIAEAEVLGVAVEEFTMQHGPPEVGIQKDRLESVLGERRRAMDRTERLSFRRNRACQKKSAAAFLGSDEREGCGQRAEGFGLAGLRVT